MLGFVMKEQSIFHIPLRVPILFSVLASRWKEWIAWLPFSLLALLWWRAIRRAHVTFIENLLSKWTQLLGSLNR